MSALLQLAERCEQATCGSMDLDTQILAALGFTWRGMGYWSADDKTMWKTSAKVTQSIDAAMSLVSAECLAMIRQLWDGPKRYGYAYVTQYTEDAEGCDGRKWAADFYGCAETPALALCAAALRARAPLSQSASTHNGEAPITTAIEVGCGGKAEQ